MEIWDESTLYRVLRSYANWCTRTSFRRFKVEGRENIPDGVPVILTPNHCCSLLDAMVVLNANRNLSAFGSRADIFRNKAIAAFLHFCRMVPLARQRDTIAEMRENLHTFDKIVECIDHGVNFCIFVEGRHRPERGLMPVKRGVFKICDIARKETGKEVAIVPVGLAYEGFFDYMQDVTVRFGKPVMLSQHPDEKPEELLADRILELIRDYPVHKPIPMAARIPLFLLTLPLFAVSGVLSAPMLISAAIIRGKLKDKAWTNTVRYACKVALIPILVIIWAVAGFILLPWWGALILIIAVLYAQPIWYLLFNLYKPVFKK